MTKLCIFFAIMEKFLDHQSFKKLGILKRESLKWILNFLNYLINIFQYFLQLWPTQRIRGHIILIKLVVIAFGLMT